MQELKTLWNLALSEKWALSYKLTLILISSSITMAVPYGMGQIVDIIFDNNSGFQAPEYLSSFCVGILSLVLIQAVCTFVRAYLMKAARDRIRNKLKTEVFSAILKQEIGFFDKNRTGDLMDRLSNDTSQISYCVTENIAKGLQAFFQAIIAVSMMIYQSPQLARIILTILPVFAIISIIAGFYLKKLRKVLQCEQAMSTQILEERISNIRTVRAYCQEELETRTYRNRLDIVQKLGSEESWIHLGLTAMAEVGSAVIIVIVLYYGGEMMTNQNLTIGTLLTFSLYVILVGNALHGMSHFYTEVMKGQGSSIRLGELINRIPSIPLTDGETPTDTVTGTIRFHNVSFFYPTRPDSLVLDNLSLDIPGGSTLAIVGPSGTGKTTLVSLLLRFYNPTSGTIRLDGVDISRLNPQWLREQIAVVSQEPVIFSGSIKDNILYGAQKPDEVSQNRLNQVAEESNSLEFIRRFDDKFDTVLGDRGVMLSTGQKQRIAIARAMVKNPKILIFDEATSSLDTENEYLVQRALERVAENRTVIIIAHRLSSIRNANKIAVVADGKCAEIGGYEDLMKIPYGKFRKLVERQALKINPDIKTL